MFVHTVVVFHAIPWILDMARFPTGMSIKTANKFLLKRTETGMGRCMIYIYIDRIKHLGPHIFPNNHQSMRHVSQWNRRESIRSEKFHHESWWKWNRPHYEIQSPGERFAGIKYAWKNVIDLSVCLFTWAWATPNVELTPVSTPVSGLLPDEWSLAAAKAQRSWCSRFF